MEQNGPTDNQHQARTLRTIPVTVISFTKIQLKSNSRTTRVTSRSRHQYTGLNGVTPQKPVIFRNRTRYWNHCATHCHIVRRSFTHKQEIRNSLLHLLLPSSFITHFFFSSSLPTLLSTWFTDLLSIILCFSLHILQLSSLAARACLTILPAVQDSKQPHFRYTVRFFFRHCKPYHNQFTFKRFKCTVCKQQQNLIFVKSGTKVHQNTWTSKSL